MHVFVQKNVVESPAIEHSGAAGVIAQSPKPVQNFPIPSSLPMSPGSPHVEKNASTVDFASGFFALLLLLHAAHNASANEIRYSVPAKVAVPSPTPTTRSTGNPAVLGEVTNVASGSTVLVS